jgi:hypothetical protein
VTGDWLPTVGAGDQTHGAGASAGELSAIPMPTPQLPQGVAAGSPEHTFLETLAGGRPDPPVGLPPAVRPLARALVGPRAVEVVAGATTRRALASVGKRAATTGSTIHLERPPAASLRADELEVIAHELSHVAQPSPVPRFFAGRTDEEELEARRVGEQERGRSRLAAIADTVRSPKGGTRGLPVGGVGAVAGLVDRVDRVEASAAAADAVIRRAVSTPPAAASPSTSPAAASPAISTSTPSGASTGASVVRRSTSGPTSSTTASSASVIRRAESGPGAPGASREATSTDQRERLDRLVVDLERRLRREAERRRWRYGELF